MDIYDPLLGDLLLAKRADDPLAAPVTHRSFVDPVATRKAIYGQTLQAAQALPPISNQKYTLSLHDVDYADPENRSRKDVKQAVLRGDTLSRRLKGTWRVTDNVTGAVVGSKQSTIAHVPHYTDGGVFVLNGSKYSLASQMRLRPGVYTRRKENGELESHFNVLPGQGLSHRIHLDPETGVFNIEAAQSQIPLAPVLKAMGITDRQLKEHWGELYGPNMAKAGPQAVPKFLSKLTRGDLPAEDSTRQQQLKELIEKMPVDPEVMRETIGHPHSHLNADVYLAATKKLIGLNKGEIGPDDRDHPAFMTVYGPEDLVAERMQKDHALLRRALWKLSLKQGDPSSIPTGLFTKPLVAAIMASGLGQPLEEVNPLGTLEQAGRISRMGVGGLPSVDAIPGESRSVQPGHYGYIDPVSTPENMRAGVDSRSANSVLKGSDNRLYAPFHNVRTGKQELLDPTKLVRATIAFPGEMAPGKQYPRAMVGGRIRPVPRSQVDYVLPHFENAFGHLSNLVPMKSAIKAQRLSMGARMTTQALPLKGGEAPLVQSGIPGSGGSRSFEEEYGKHAGAIRADQGGYVKSITEDALTLETPDGREVTHELAYHEPSNRKTGTNHTPVVRVGQMVQPGELLARSNYTDEQGTTALGRNVRIAMLPGFGSNSNYEDAWVISESAAKDKFRSEHYYQHDLPKEDGVRFGRNTYVAAFPGKFTKHQLANFDDQGVIKPGTTVEHGDPLILGVRENAANRAQIYKGHTPAYSDVSETWEHHNPGVVTDVVQGKDGPRVVVRTEAPTEVGDKLSSRFGGKGVVGSIVPDDQMPVAEDGKPVELLFNPVGIISRGNPAAAFEFALGKIAAKTGKPYKIEDFESIEDLQNYVSEELKKHDVKDLETVTDPRTGKKIPNVMVGNGFFMKLHHTVECFDDKTEVLTVRGWVPWPEVTPRDLLATVDDGQLVYERPICIVQSPSPGVMHCFSGRYLDYAVTANHRHYVRLPYVEKEWQMEDASVLHGRRFCVQQFGFRPDDPERLGKVEPPVIDGRALTWSDYAELVGWWVTEGYAKVTQRAACVVLYQSETANPEKLAKIVALAGRLGFPWCYYRVNGVIFGVVINNRPLAVYLKSHGTHSDNKRLPRLLFAAPLDARQIAYETILGGDGCRQEDGHCVSEEAELRFNESWQQTAVVGVQRTASLTTTSKGLADDFQELCIRVGLGAVPRQLKPRKETHCLPAWKCGIALTRTVAQVDGCRRKSGFSLRPYSGTVYCAEMRTGLLYVRRNGKPMLTGNSKIHGRGTGGYTAEGQPSRSGGTESAKRMAMMSTNALLSHGSTDVIRDGLTVRGQASPQYWMAFMSGHTPPNPEVPLVHRKFVNQLKAAGINVIREGTKFRVYAMTQPDIDHLAGGRVLRNAETVGWKEGLKPVPGGLFSEDLTGGHGGNKWASMKLHEAFPNPVMEEPIRRIFGLTEQKYRDILAGKEEFRGERGPRAIAGALDRLNLDQELARARMDIASGKRTYRDQAIRRLGYLKSAKENDVHPRDWVWNSVPVLPPIFRPVSVMKGDKRPMVADANELYKHLWDANENLKHMQGRVDDVGLERLATYDAMKAVAGIDDPIHPKSKERGVRGILQELSGSSPKFGAVQRKLLSAPVDLVGRSVIVPNPDLDIDSVGIPESHAWPVYKNFIVRRMVRNGMKMPQAIGEVEKRTDRARAAMLAEMEERPVILDRAPVLHRYGIMAFRPRLVKGDTIHLSPLVTSGFGADFDGDQMNYQVPAGDEAVREAMEKLLPSKNLIAVSNFQVHQVPTREFATGLWYATRAADKDKHPQVFRSKADAIAAHRRGELEVDQPIEILQH